MGRTRSIRGMLWAGAATTALALACGGEEAETPRAGAWQAPAASSSSRADGRNQTPEVLSVRFSPDEALVGRPLRALVEAEDGDGDPVELGFTWTIAGSRIPSDGAEISVPPGLRRGDRIRVSVLASDGRSTADAFEASVPVANRPPRMASLEVHVVQEDEDDPGRWVADPVGEDPDGDDLDFRFEWTVGDRVLEDAEEWLSRAGRKRGEQIQLRVWASDGVDESAPRQRALRDRQLAARHRLPSAADGRLGSLRLRRRGTGSRRRPRAPLLAGPGPQGMTIDPFSGEVRWTATVEDAGEHQVTIAVDDRNGGVTRQTFYVDVTTTGGSGRNG
ncbi:MAG: putative Ig domain-containing protein [Myxococcota bacterium]